MTIRRLTLLLLLASNLLPVATAHAAAPSKLYSTCPGFIRLVGETLSDSPDVTDGLFTVFVLDDTKAAIYGSRVTVSFCGAGDLLICRDQRNAAYTVDCAAGTVSALTDQDGRVDFTIVGGSNGGMHGSSLRGTVEILADDPTTHQNVLLSDASSTTGLVCSALDEDGVNGLGGNDISLFALDVGSQWQRSDFNGDGVVDSADQSILSDIFFSARMMASCPAYCPSCATPTSAETWGSLKLRYR